MTDANTSNQVKITVDKPCTCKRCPCCGGLIPQDPAPAMPYAPVPYYPAPYVIPQPIYPQPAPWVAPWQSPFWVTWCNGGSA